MNTPLIAATLAATLSISPLLAGTAAAQETAIRAGHFIASPNSGFRSVFNTWVERVNAEGKGLIRIPSVVSEESIPGMQMPTAVRNGVIDMAAVPPSYYYNVVPEGESTVLAQIPPPEQRTKGSFDILQGELNRKLNIHMLGQYGYNVRFHVFLNKEVAKVEDFKPLKLRTTPAYRPFFARLVNSQLQTPRGEVYTALERGVVDGYGNPNSEVKSAGWDKVSKFRVDPGFYNTMVHILVNKKFWDSLRPDQRAFLDRMAQQVLEKDLDPKMAENEIVAGKALEAGGMKVITLDNQNAQQYLKLAYDAHWDEISKVTPENGRKLRALMSK
jgi:TRAP-type C4-dicarboxylate transport system substrate-binding protein